MMNNRNTFSDEKPHKKNSLSSSTKILASITASCTSIGLIFTISSLSMMKKNGIKETEKLEWLLYLFPIFTSFFGYGVGKFYIYSQVNQHVNVKKAQECYERWLETSKRPKSPLPYLGFDFPPDLLEKNGITIPEEFTCPITLSIFNEPVLAPDNNTYERSALQVWYDNSNNTCPLIPSVTLTNPSQLKINTSLLASQKAWLLRTIDPLKKTEENTSKEKERLPSLQKR